MISQQTLKRHWWVGVAAGVALGLGTVAAIEATTDDADAAAVRVTPQQLLINQRIASAAVTRSNTALKRIGSAETRITSLEGRASGAGPSLLWSVSTGKTGESLIPGRGTGVGSIFQANGQPGVYTVKFAQGIAACTWSATIAADDPNQLTSARDIRVALNLGDAARTQLNVYTTRADGNRVNSPFQIQVFC